MLVIPEGRIGGRAVAAACALVCALAAGAAESPASYGAAARVDTPILRIPFMAKAPTIDGVMEPGEWEDSSALSGFWYDYGQCDFRFMAPPQTQLQVYGGFDKENLYFCVSSPVFPENSWLKARGRYPDVLSHPLYGTLWDDHCELELRPFADVSKGFQHGLLRFDVNPIGTVADWFWSQKTGHDWKWQSGAKIRTQADGKRWIIEYAIPLASLVYDAYAGTDASGRPLVTLPPADGTVYRAWFTRGIGGNGNFFNTFDNHMWNTCKTALIFDSQAPSFQINELGPVMEDIVDVRMTVKNHNSRSETVRLGFFVESAEGTVYSSYDAPGLKEGLLELRPGEVRQIRLQQPFPGVSRDGNVLWFDVRSAGKPAKTLFLTRLIRFHSMEGGALLDRGSGDMQSFMDRRVNVIATLRPPRKPFDFRVDFSPYTRKLAAVVDRGIHGASEEAQRAVDAKLTVSKAGSGDVVKEATVRFRGNFCSFLLDAPELVEGEPYEVTVLLFDGNRAIVGEEVERQPFVKLAEGEGIGKRSDRFLLPPWMGNTIGMEDALWEPFTAIRPSADGFETLKHRFTLAPSGLPAQLEIRPDPRELPLERRGDVPASPAELLALGRGPQFRAPLRLEAVIGGRRVAADVTAPARAVRTGVSEIEYVATLQFGALPATLTTRYDCDGSLHATLAYGSEQPVAVEALELVADIAGRVDLVLSETGGGAMTGADRWECALTNGVGVVWDSTLTQMDLFYNKFIPWFWFGSADRAWSWYCDSDEGWILDREGSSMQLERDARGDVTWRVRIVNHAAEIAGARTVAFSILTHPAKPKPKNFRKAAWHYHIGAGNMSEYAFGRYDYSDQELLAQWRAAASAPKETPDSERTTFRKDEGAIHRYGWWRNVQMRVPEMDRAWEDKATFYFERFIRIGRRVGWWMDEYFPVGFGRSENLAAGNAYLRDPAYVSGDELPWHSKFLTTHMRDHYKRLARVFAKNNVPQRQHTWSGNGSNMLEPFLWNSTMVEECGAGCRAYEVDMITQFPNSLYRVMGKNYTGLIATLVADFSLTTPGDDKRVDRQRHGLALLHDFGAAPNGPHGTHHHKEQAVRLLSALQDFGFFEDDGIEKLPFWRNSEYLRIGDAPSEESKVYVTAYRRPLAGGGCKALFVILNEGDADAELPLALLEPERILGGANTLRIADVYAEVRPPAFLEGAWDAAAAAAGGRAALKDVETGEAVARMDGPGERYGPVFVPYHDYRILYGHF